MVLSEAKEGGEEVSYDSFMTGQTAAIKIARTPATKTMLVKHLMAESSGISYDMWTDFMLIQTQGVSTACAYMS